MAILQKRKLWVLRNSILQCKNCLFVVQKNAIMPEKNYITNAIKNSPSWQLIAQSGNPALFIN